NRQGDRRGAPPSSSSTDREKVVVIVALLARSCHGRQALVGELDALDVAEVQVVDGEVRGDRAAEVAHLPEERAEPEADDERARRPGQVASTGADVEEREDERRRPEPDPRQERAAKEELLADGAREREHENVARVQIAEESAEGAVQAPRPVEAVD